MSPHTGLPVPLQKQLQNQLQNQLQERLQELAPALESEARTCDGTGEFPAAGMAALRAAGLLLAPLPVACGGLGLHGAEGARGLFELLHRLGSVHLALGRIFEAHVNALELVRRYGTAGQLSAAARDAEAGELFALWVTDGPENRLRLDRHLVLHGEKWFCSAAGFAGRALVTAETADGPQMLVVAVEPPARVTHKGVRLAGMRAAVTGSVDLSGVELRPDALLGRAGDYLREPVFSTGAWRSSAVALGGVAALMGIARQELRRRGRDTAPYQRMRFGQLAIAHETGRLWLAEAAVRAEGSEASEAVAYVNLARTAVETASLSAVQLVQRSLGLAAFMAGSDAERVARDLETYLRQPAPDEALAEAAGYYLREGEAP